MSYRITDFIARIYIHKKLSIIENSENIQNMESLNSPIESEIWYGGLYLLNK